MPCLIGALNTTHCSRWIYHRTSSLWMPHSLNGILLCYSGSKLLFREERTQILMVLMVVWGALFATGRKSIPISLPCLYCLWHQEPKGTYCVRLFPTLSDFQAIWQILCLLLLQMSGWLMSKLLWGKETVGAEYLNTSGSLALLSEIVHVNLEQSREWNPQWHGWWGIFESS